MDKKTLLLFIQRILENGSVFRARLSLEELGRILVQQQAPQDMIELIRKTIDSVPEAKEEAQKGTVSEQDLAVAYERARIRIQRERMARSYGRC